jgi:hypothetical protein
MQTAELVATRHAWHALAEHLLAGDLHRSTGRIGLRVTPGGFGQPEHFVAAQRRRLRIDGGELVVLTGDEEDRYPLTTLQAAATAAGTVVGAPEGVYELLTQPDPDAAFAITAGAAASLGEFFAFGERCLEDVRRVFWRHRPTLLQLWPEHLDLAGSIGEVNIGASPGDAAIETPYLYVGPWQVPADPWWDQPWGRALRWSPAMTVADGVAFLAEGLHRAGVQGAG